MENIWNTFINSDELQSDIVDIYDRRPNIFYSGKILSPSVSDYLIERGFEPKYPGGKKFAVAISHDIDSLANDEINLIKTEHYGGVRSALKMVRNEIVNSYRVKRAPKSPTYIPKGFRELINISKERKIPSSFYFLSLLPGEPDFSYDVADIAHVFSQVKEIGGEIGLHGGHEAYASAEKMKHEKDRLENACGNKVIGYRNHYLRFDRTRTWQGLSESGFAYDTTYGDANSPGFRNGMCHPFQPFDLQTNQFIDLVEVPLIYMDDSPRAYLHLDNENAWKLFCKLVDATSKVKGVFTLLWHNTNMDRAGSNYYIKAIEYLKKLDPWFATGEQISEHYKTNRYFETINSILIDAKNERD